MRPEVQEMSCDVREENVESAVADSGCAESVGADHKDADTLPGEAES